jgi:hypothetical protein
VSEASSSALQKVFSQITDPWDWAAAALGLAGGLGATIALHGTDLGAFAAGGASAGIAGRKAIVASLQRPRLRRKARGLLKSIKIRMPEGPENAHFTSFSRLADAVILELEMWESDHTSTANEEFSKKLAQIENHLRGLVDPQMGVQILRVVSGN